MQTYFGEQPHFDQTRQWLGERREDVPGKTQGATIATRSRAEQDDSPAHHAQGKRLQCRLKRSL